MSKEAVVDYIQELMQQCLLVNDLTVDRMNKLWDELTPQEKDLLKSRGLIHKEIENDPKSR